MSAQGAVTTRWEIRMESASDGLTVDRTGRIKTGQSATRIGYRPVGKRGRFEWFALYGDLPADHQKLVDTYNAEHGPRAWR